MRSLLLLPWRLLVAFTHLCARWLRPVTGELAWSPPQWWLQTRRAPAQTFMAMAGALLVLVVGVSAWRYSQRLPKPVQPDRISWTVVAPAITDYTTQPIQIHTLSVTFSGSAAPLALVGKTVPSGISLKPSVAGRWVWQNDRELTFTPATDWPVGQHFRLQFEPGKTFAPQALVVDEEGEFDTPAFTASIESGEFNQNPQDGADKTTVATLRFNYPVDTAQLEQRVRLAYVGRDGHAGPPLPFTVNYDANRLAAYIRSQPLQLPRDDASVAYEIDSGVRSARGGDGTGEALHTSVVVPGLYSLQIADMDATLVDNERFEPEQVLVMNLSGAVRADDLSTLVHAWVLPQHKLPAPQQAALRQNDQSENQDAAADEQDAAAEEQYDWSPTEISQGVLRASQPLKLESVATEAEYAPLQSFKFRATPGQRLYVSVSPGIQAFGGYIMGKPRSQILTVPEYPKLLRFMGEGSLLSMNGSKRVSVVSRNVPGMRLDVGRVLPEQLQHLVSMNQADFGHPQLVHSFGEDRIVERFEVKREIPAGDPASAHYEGVDLSPYLAGGRRGVFLLHLSSFDPVAEKKAAARRQRQLAAAAGANGVLGVRPRTRRRPPTPLLAMPKAVTPRHHHRTRAGTRRIMVTARGVMTVVMTVMARSAPIGSMTIA